MFSFVRTSFVRLSLSVDYQYSPQTNNADLQFIKGADLFPGSQDEPLTPAADGAAATDLTGGADEEAAELNMTELDRHNQRISMRAALKNRIPSIADGDDEDYDSEMDEEDGIDDEDDANYTAFSAANPARVAHLVSPRAYPPEPVPAAAAAAASAAASKKVDAKHCWSLADEASTGLPKANHAKVSLDIRNVRTHYCCGNLMIVEEYGQRCTAITGTLRSASTPTKYILVGGTIFEWVKGASASG